MIFDWTVTIGGVDVSALVKTGGTIDYGRPTRFTAFQAPQAVFEMFTEADYPNFAGTWPAVDLGDAVIIHVTWDGVTQWRRFTGVVQALDWSTAGMRVTCAGNLVKWQERYAGGTTSYYPIPIELETTRVQRLVDDANETITIEGVAARKLRAIPINEPSGPLLDHLIRVADNCDGLLMEDRLGVAHYRTRNFARPSAYTLPDAVIERDSIDMAYEFGTLVNAVRVYYGEPDATTGNRPYVYDNDTAGANTIGNPAIGERLEEIDTDIQYTSGATGKAAVHLERRRLAWEAPDVVVLMNQATGAQADDILDLQENWRVQISTLPAGCPIATYEADILGFTELMFQDDYRIILHLSPDMLNGSEYDTNIIYPDEVLTGYDSTGTYVDGTETYRWIKFSTVGAHTLTNTHTDVVSGDMVACAGGGGGGAYLYPGGPSGTSGGGGAGGTYSEGYDVAVGNTAITIGAGGAGADVSTPPYYGVNGQDTTVGDLTLLGGGGGGGTGNEYVAGAWTPGDGQDGGSGGGGGNGAPGGAAIGPFGHDGGAGGGGAVGVGGSGAGAGYVSTIDGSSVEYGRGGNQVFTAGTLPGQGGGGGYNAASQRAGADGAAGIVVFRYRIA